MLTFLLAVILWLMVVASVVLTDFRRTDPHHSFALALINSHLGGTSHAVHHDGHVRYSGDWLAANSLFRRRRPT